MYLFLLLVSFFLSALFLILFSNYGTNPGHFVGETVEVLMASLHSMRLFLPELLGKVRGGNATHGRKGASIGIGNKGGAFMLLPQTPLSASSWGTPSGPSLCII